jgi:CheY-like chemotaxis protein
MIPKVPTDSRTNYDVSGRTFLVIEDDADSRDFLSELLRSRGAIAVVADNIRTAKQYVRTMKFDMIVTDLSLPGEDGAMFLKWLRALPPEHSGANTPAVAVTAFYKTYPPAQVSGWAAYFQKPIQIGQFVSTVASILRIPAQS